MKKLYVLHILFFAVGVRIDSQSADDFRSAGSGSWASVNTWERFDGTMWLAAGTTPSSVNGVVSIQSPHTVSLSNAVTIDQVIVDTGGTLVIATNLTLNDVMPRYIPQLHPISSMCNQMAKP